MDYLTELFNLKGKIAAVIGGAGFLCGEMARGLARAGVKVAVLDKNEEALKVIEKEIHALGGDVLTVFLEATQKRSHLAARKKILNAYGDCDILINGAGINAPTPFFEITREEWQAILDSHMTATFLGCQVFGDYMVEKKKGAIINMSSVSAGPPLSKAFTYSVAKAGVRNLTQNLGREWAKSQVRVNALRPGFFPTEWSKRHFIDKKRHQVIVSHTPMGRYGEPKELVGAVLWLSSDAASFVTGAEITVDGGFTCMTI